MSFAQFLLYFHVVAKICLKETKFMYRFSDADQRGVEISTILCIFSLNSYSLA